MSFVKIWAMTLLLLFSVVIVVFCLPVLTPFFLSAIFAYVLYTPTRFLERKLKIKSWLAAMIVIVLCFFAIVFALYLFLPPLMEQGKTLVSSIPDVTKTFDGMIKNVQSELDRREVPPEVVNGVNTALNRIYGLLSDFVVGFINYMFSLVTKVIDIFFIIVITVYMLVDGERLIKKFIKMIPDKYEPRVERITKDIDHLMKNYIKAQIYIAAITGIGTLAILMLLGVEYSAIIAMLAFFLNFIPYFGATFVTVLAGAISYFTGGIVKALIVWLLLTIFGQIKGNIINPKIQSKASGMHPLTVLLAILVCNYNFGIFGMFVAIVVAGVIKLIYKNAIEIIAEL